MRVLITGIAGFAGPYLTELLRERGDDVHGLVREATSRKRLGAPAPRFPSWEEDRLHVADVTDATAVADVIAAVKPDGVFHLAGVTFVPDSLADPARAFRVNLLGTVNLLAAVHRHRPACRVLAVTSADAYGAVTAGDLPVREHCPFRPLTPYGASKAAADLAAYQWAHGAGLDVVRVRPFNHTGAGQRPDFVCPNFARQLAAIERGQQPPEVSAGDLDVVRDFSDVRDVVAAYVAAFERGQRGEAYNVCSGVGRSVRSVLEALIEMAGIPVRVTVAPERIRPGSVPAIVGCADRLTAATGWRPRHEWRETLGTVLADWRARFV